LTTRRTLSSVRTVAKKLAVELAVPGLGLALAAVLTPRRRAALRHARRGPEDAAAVATRPSAAVCAITQLIIHKRAEQADGAAGGCVSVGSGGRTGLHVTARATRAQNWNPRAHVRWS